jgi:hypothetical protein
MPRFFFPYSRVKSDKTDIFDFGVILLEVVSGKTITSMYEVEILKELVPSPSHSLSDNVELS